MTAEPDRELGVGTIEECLRQEVAVDGDGQTPTVIKLQGVQLKS